MLESYERHASDAERALWALAAFASTSISPRPSCVPMHKWVAAARALYLPPAQVLHCQPEDIDGLRKTLALAFTPKKGRRVPAGIDVLTRHLDGDVPLDIRRGRTYSAAWSSARTTAPSGAMYARLCR